MITYDPKLLQAFEKDRAERLRNRLTARQLESIANDTRLPGEVAGTYGVTAAVITRIQQIARQQKNLRAALARRKTREKKSVGKDRAGT